jgi:hypothetical protein
MALPYIDGNTQFCDDSVTFFHDKTLPNKHNALCSSKSAFSIILHHKDFDGYKPLNVSHQPKPQFQLFLSKKLFSYVMVLDVSGSMIEGDRIGRMKNSAIRFVQYNIKDNVPLGLVIFSSEPEILFPLEPLTAQNRPTVINILKELHTRGGTCLGAALKAGLETLKNGGVTQGGIITFMTDGWQSCDGPDQSDIPDVIGDILAQGVKINAIEFGMSADPRMMELAEKTGGKVFFIPDGTGPEDVNNALQGSLTNEPSVPSNQSHIVIAKETFKNQSNITLPFYIDDTIGNNVVIQIDFSGNTISSIMIGNFTDTFSETNGVYEKVFDTLESGKYELIISSSSSIQFASIEITSKAKNDTLPIFTRCWTSAGMETIDVSRGQKVAIMAQVLQGTNSVIRAKVKAFIARDGDNDPIEIELFDQGSDPDSIKDDGIYSRYFTSFHPSSEEVRYTVKCQIRSTAESAVNYGFLNARKTSQHSSHSRSLPRRPSDNFPICCGSSAVTEDSVLFPTGEFGRTEISSMLSVISSDQANFPPGFVNDLIAGDLNLTASTFTLKFTAPGSMLDSGTPDAYKIYYSTNQLSLTNISGLENCEFINETYLASGSANMTPAEAGSPVKLTLLIEHFFNFQLVSPKIKFVHLNSTSSQYFFLLETSAGTLKSISNIARIYLNRFNGDNHWNSQSNVIADCYIIAYLLTFLTVVSADVWR